MTDKVKSTKQKREDAQKSITNAQSQLKRVEKKISIQKQLRDVVLDNFVFTDSYKGQVQMKYQLEPEFMQANREKKKLDYEETIEQLEQQKQQLEEFISEQKQEIKENRG